MSKNTVFGLFTEECYSNLVNTYSLSSECLKFTISKGLGYAIILGSFGLKVPQILNIQKSQSSDGLVLSALYLEILSFVCISSYNMLLGTELSTYAESLVILVQNLYITYLFWKYSGTPVSQRMAAIVGLVVICFTITVIPASFWSILLLFSAITSLSGRTSTIFMNFKNGSTGVQSLPTTIMQVAGTAIRLFTTFVEVDDMGLITICFLSFVMNLIVLLQIFFYWGKQENKSVMSNTAVNKISTKTGVTPKKKSLKAE